MNAPVLVTGATGFLGGAIARELVGAGYAVHALARETSDRSGVPAPEVTWHVGDLTRPETLAAAFAAMPEPRWLVHNAAVISYRAADAALQREVNVEGTRAVLVAARKSGVQRVVHVSSVVTVGHAAGDEALDEYAEWNGAQLGVDYVTTKHTAERIALSVADALDLRVVNPSAIFGPASARTNTARFVRSIARGEAGPLVPPGGMSVVGVDDVAAGVRLALEAGETGRRYLLSESYYSLADLFRIVTRTLHAEGIGARAPRWRLPRSLWPAVVAGARAVDRRRPLELATPQALTMLGCRWRVRSDRARRELGWRPRPFEDVLLETVRDLAARLAS